MVILLLHDMHNLVKDSILLKYKFNKHILMIQHFEYSSKQDFLKWPNEIAFIVHNNQITLSNVIILKYNNNLF